MQYISRLSSSYCAQLVLRTLVRGDYASLVFLDTHRNLLISDFMTCIRYIVVFCSRTFSCTSPLSQRIISYVLGSTYLEILRDDLTNIYNNYLLCSFQRTNNLYISRLSSLPSSHLSCVITITRRRRSTHAPRYPSKSIKL